VTDARLRVLVLGIAGRLPFAGVAWQTLHYLEGLRRLGHDVHYAEDTGEWPFDVERNAITEDPSYTVGYLARVMDWGGFGDRWMYVAASEGRRVYGVAAAAARDVLDGAEVLINLSGATALRDEHLRVPVRIYLETDPVLPQLEIASGRRRTIDHLAHHTHHVTFAENLGGADCEVPAVPVSYRPTRQPVVLDWWSPPTGPSDAPPRFTTIASWRQTEKDVEWQGRMLRWSKDERFARVLELPRRARARFELALAEVDADSIHRLTGHGWRVIDAVALTKDLLPYRDYVWGSHAEFTVAKAQNVCLRSGWFSDRSACYLAAGRPVVTEDTAFARVLPIGRGLFAFRGLDEAVAAVDAIMTNYRSHQQAAREIAREYFAADRVVADLLRGAGLQ
jgi:hypothetical protein